MYSPPQRNHIRWKQGAFYALKLLVSGACFYYIYHEVAQSSVVSKSIDRWLFDHRFLTAAGAVLVLLPLNWLLEIMKWEQCVRPIKPVSRGFAAAGVLRGLALNWVIPFTLGDFMGRLLGIPKSRRSIKAIVVSRAYALGTTSWIGILAACQWYFPSYLWLCWIASTFLFLIWTYLISRDTMYGPSQHLVIAGLTLLRYLVFFLQLLLLLWAVMPVVTLPMIALGIAIVFLIRTLVPSLLGALGVREAAIVFVFSPLVPEVTPLLVASFTLWVINIILPSIVGVWPLLAYRFKFTL